ncbi:MAG: hypothetical protein ACHQVK_04485 [Candidatus Paceibacterales bacterium]
MKSNAFSRIISIIVGAMFVLTVGACGQSLNGQLPANSSNNGSSNSIPANLWAGIDTTGSGSNAFSTQSFSINPATNMLTISFTLPSNIFGGSMSVSIPELPGATVSIQPDPVSGAWTLSFNIPLKLLVRGAGLIGPTTLPNGDPLPGVPGGEPPRIAAHITKGNLEMYVYGNVKYFGLFVPTPKLNQYLLLNLSFPIENKGKTQILGYFSTVAPKGLFDSGMFVSIVFPPALSRLLDQIF